jgi:hypothetical protein
VLELVAKEFTIVFACLLSPLLSVGEVDAGDVCGVYRTRASRPYVYFKAPSLSYLFIGLIIY